MKIFLRIFTLFFIIFPLTNVLSQTVSKIQVDKNQFKQSSNDTRISKKVAEIFNKIDSVVLVDLNSVERSFINGKILKGIDSTLNHVEFIDFKKNIIEKILRDKPSEISVVFRFKGKLIKLNLVQVNLFTDNFKILSNEPDKVKNINLGIQYQGVIDGEKSIATFNFFEDEFSALIASRTDGNINIGKIMIPGIQSHVIYSDNDSKFLIGKPCLTDDNNINKRYFDSRKQLSNLKNLQSLKCVSFFWETQYNMYTYLGNTQAVSNFVVSIFNGFNALYQNETIGTKLNNIFIWTSQDPYGEGNAHQRVVNYSAIRNNYGADLADLLGNGGGGGEAQTIGGVCENEGHAFCGDVFEFGGFFTTYTPNFTWPIEESTHEVGHSLGSPHTHFCFWNGNHTAIDGCGPTYNSIFQDPNCPIGPIPPLNSGTMMSYCHLLDYVKIDLNLGFGEQPGNVIRNTVNVCIANTCDYYNTCTDNFEPNNSYTNGTDFFAGPLGSGNSNQNINANIGYQDDVDWYKVTLAACGNLTITLSTLPHDYDIELYGSNGSNGAAILGSYSAGTQNEILNFQSVSSNPSTYYIKIYSAIPNYYSNASCYNLKMQWTSISCTSCSAPSITSQPINKSVVAPTGTSFSISSSGSNNVKQWQYNTGSGWINVPNSSPYSGVSTNTLTINSTTIGMNGYRYRCYISSTCTSATVTSNEAVLSVNSSSGCNNDLSCNPKILPITTSCVSTSCTTIGATPPSPDITFKSCAGVFYQTGRYDDDVWFSITTTNSSPITIKVTPTSNLSNFDPVIGLYSGTCSSATQLAGGCADVNPSGGTEQLVYTPVAGATYLIRVFGYGIGGAYSGNFDICVTTVGQPAPADLVITNPDFSVNNICAGDVLNVSYDIENIGGTTASPSTVKYYLSSNSTLSGSDVLLSSTSVNSIGSNSSVSFSKNLTIPASTASGTWYILIIADANDDISEGSNGESNNLNANSIQVNNCTGQADLIIHADSYNPTTITPSTTVHINYTGQNIGTANASPIQIGIYISTDNVFNPNSDELLNDWFNGHIDAGDSYSSILNFTVPNCYPCGSYYVFLVIDYQNVVPETDNSNNTDYFQIDITGCTSCTYSVPATGINFQSAGGSGNIPVTTTFCCPWNAVSNDNWISLVNGSGTGTGAVSYSVSPCNSGGTRTGSITVEGQIHTITQNCVETCNASQSFAWAVRAGSTTLSDAAADLALDLSGNLYMTGDIQGSADFGSGITLTTPTVAPDVFVSKHNSSGQIQWAVQFGNTKQDMGTAIATDNAGNIYVGGNFENSVIFGSTTLTGNVTDNNTAFIVKLNSDGVVQWARKINASNIGSVSDLVIDNDNNIIVSGDLDYSQQLFISKYNSSGTQLWYNTYGTSNIDTKSIYGIAADNTGNIFICGRYQRTITLGAFTLNTIYSTLDIDGFTSKLDQNGNVIWLQKLTSPGQGQDELRAIAVDNANNIYTVGNVDSTAIVGPITIPLTPTSKQIIIKYDQDGNPLWAKASVSGSSFNSQAITKGLDNIMYFCGDFSGTMQIDSFSITCAGDNDAFVISIDDNGKIKWMKRYGGVQSESARGIVTNAANDVFLAGGFYGTVAFGNTTVTSAGSEDIYLAKFKQCDPPAATISYAGNLVLCPGQTLMLSTDFCSTNNYQWLLNGVEIGGANNPTYNSSEPGEYRVTVSAFEGCETLSSPIIINSQGSFTFTGTGNWDEPGNWINNAIPPSPLPSCYEIIIDPQIDGECILNVPQIISPGGKITVKTNKKFRVTGDLIIQQ